MNRGARAEVQHKVICRASKSVLSKSAPSTKNAQSVQKKEKEKKHHVGNLSGFHACLASVEILCWSYYPQPVWPNTTHYNSYRWWIYEIPIQSGILDGFPLPLKKFAITPWPIISKSWINQNKDLQRHALPKRCQHWPEPDRNEWCKVVPVLWWSLYLKKQSDYNKS